MLVICEDCAKKYDIDISKIKGDKAYFPCKKCKHQIVVEKPVVKKVDEPSPEGLSQSEEKIADILTSSESATLQVEKKEKGRGIPIAVYFIFPLLVGFLAVNGAFGYLYFKYIPELMYQQVDLRSEAVASSFQKTIHTPLTNGDFSQIAIEAKLMSKMPDIAYIAVIDQQGAAVVGEFGELNKFDKTVYTQAKNKGFPAHYLRQNVIQGSNLVSNARLMIGGQKVHDKALALKAINGELHVGVFVGSVDKALKDALLSPILIAIVAVPWIGGMLAFFLLARYLTTPLKDLTAIVHRISLGELDLSIEPHGPRELRDFARAFERMRYSIREAINRLKTS